MNDEGIDDQNVLRFVEGAQNSANKSLGEIHGGKRGRRRPRMVSRVKGLLLSR